MGGSSRDSRADGSLGSGVLDAAFIHSWIRAAASDVAAKRDYLTQLDAAIGDADHGVNLDRGFAAALVELDASEDRSPGQLLEAVGTTIVNTVGGAAGPLYGSGLRRAGGALGQEPTFDGDALVGALHAALEAIQGLGAAVEGDKTIVDAWIPGLAAFEREMRGGGSVTDAARRAAVAAEEGARETVPMQARKGRASYLGPRSVGHQDPGATSTALLFRALAHAARDRTA